MSAENKKKRRSQAPVALVYFVTVLIFLGLFSLLSIYLLKQFNVIDDSNAVEDDVVSSVTFNNLYARVNSKGVLSDLAVVRIAPEASKIVVVPIPALTVNKGSTQTFRDIFDNGGVTKLEEAVTNTYGLEIDNYMSVSNTAFETIADLFGGISYTAEEELYYLSQDNDENDIFISEGEFVNLTGRQIRLLCQYPVFSDGKQGNFEFMGYAVTNIVNSAFQQANVAMDNLDNIYDILTENSDTDMTEDDFKLQKSYVKTMMSSNLAPAVEFQPTGTWSEDDTTFTVSEDFIESLKEMEDITAPAVEVSSEE